MDAVLFTLLLLSFSLSLINVVLMILTARLGDDPGYPSLLRALVPLSSVTFFEILNYFLQNHLNRDGFPLIDLGLLLSLLGVTLGWNHAVIRHYELNGLPLYPRTGKRIFAAGAGILTLSCFLTLLHIPLLGFLLPRLFIILLFYAGFQAVLISRKKKPLLGSTKIGRFIALASLISYPAIATGEMLGVRFPLLDHKADFWVQAHPVYAFIINIPLLVLLVGQLRKKISKPELLTMNDIKLSQVLSRRELEVARLLYQGCRYEEIAEKLYLSTATIRTHVHHIYQKLQISRREEFFILMRNKRPDPDH